jgi:hypothetical protein
MNLSHNDAEEALAMIHKMTQKTQQSLASSSAYITLFITGIVWFIGYLCTQFLTGVVVAYIWVGISLLGSAVGILLGARMGRRVRSPSTGAYAKRIGIFWLFLILYAIATIAVVRPADGKQVSMLVILFLMLGQLAMGMLISFSSTWWALPVTALALAGYFLLPGYFYLWMAVLGGGTMIVLALILRSRR